MSLSRRPLSAVLITCDAARQLPACLDSLAFCDEIVVVDSGSSDDSVALAQARGARVSSCAWRGFGAQKQYAVAQAQHDWVLCIDADERVSERLRAAIEAVLAQPAPAFGAYRLARCNRFLGRYLRHGEGYPDWNLRLFERARARWSDDSVHEKVISDGPVGSLAGELWHDTAETLSAYLDKQNRYTTLAAQQAYDAGRRGHVAQLLLSPLLRFIKFYILRRGFVDGLPGLVHILIGCGNSFVKHAKLIELQGRASPGRDPEAEPRPDPERRAETAPAAAGAATMDTPSATVAILLCTKNGARFLAEQLESIAAQTHTDWKLWLADDGSSDDTLAIATAFQRRWGEARLALHSGPGQGYAANFLFLTRHETVQGRYFAYADQDDIWEADKLARAVAWLAAQPADVPAVYGSRTRLIDAQGRDLGLSAMTDKSPSFANALVQNISGGNTAVFNQAARALLGAGGAVVAHDWWLYQVVTGCGGRVYFDSYPSVRYRQHEHNVVGANAGLASKLQRVRQLLKGRYRGWNDINVRALQALQPQLTEENRLILARFSAARKSWLLPRLLGVWRSGVRRQTLPGNLGLALAALLDKI